jgi:hypothetical protein
MPNLPAPVIEFRPMIDGNGPRTLTFTQDSIEHLTRHLA